MPKTSNVSLKNTKQEILNAYEQAILELNKKDKQAILPANTNTPTPAKATAIKTPEELISQFGGIRISLNKILGNIVDELTSQTEALSSVKTLLKKSQDELEQSYKIKQTATTLQNLFTIHEQKKIELEGDLKKFKSEKDKEKELLEKAQSEYKQELEKQRKREEEEYLYNLKLARQKDEDEYNKQKEAKELELKNREAEIQKNEQELIDLRNLVADLEQKLETETAKVSQQVKAETTKELETAFNLERKDTEREKQIAELTISNLQKTISNQDAEIVELKKQLIQATSQVKDIAVKVIESNKKENNISNQKNNLE